MRDTFAMDGQPKRSKRQTRSRGTDDAFDHNDNFAMKCVGRGLARRAPMNGGCVFKRADHIQRRQQFEIDQGQQHGLANGERCMACRV